MLALSIVFALCFGGGLVARLCGSQVVRHLRQPTIDWDSVVVWGCGVTAALCVPTLVSLVIILVSGVSFAGFAAVLVGLSIGLLAPELWIGLSAWFRDPRHAAQAIGVLVLVGGTLFVIFNLDLIFNLLWPLLSLVVVLLGLAIMLTPIRRWFR